MLKRRRETGREKMMETQSKEMEKEPTDRSVENNQVKRKIGILSLSLYERVCVWEQ